MEIHTKLCLFLFHPLLLYNTCMIWFARYNIISYLWSIIYCHFFVPTWGAYSFLQSCTIYASQYYCLFCSIFTEFFCTHLSSLLCTIFTEIVCTYLSTIHCTVYCMLIYRSIASCKYLYPNTFILFRWKMLCYPNQFDQEVLL